MMKGGNEYKKGLWTAEEDRVLTDYITVHGKGKWNRIARDSGLKRCGKSCRLRWINYLSPSVKLGDFSEEEDDLIIRLHKLLGNRWSLIAGRVPGRTDNQVKNHWNTRLSKKLGIKKGKSKETMTNSEPISGELGKNIETPSGSNLSELPNKCPDGEKVGEKVTKEASQSAIGELMMSEINYYQDAESSFLFSNYDNYDIDSSSFLVEPLEDHFLDFLWDLGL